MGRILGPVESALKNLFDRAPDAKTGDKKMKAKITVALQEARCIDENSLPKVKKRILAGLYAPSRNTNK